MGFYLCFAHKPGKETFLSNRNDEVNFPRIKMCLYIILLMCVIIVSFSIGNVKKYITLSDTKEMQKF